MNEIIKKVRFHGMDDTGLLNEFDISKMNLQSPPLLIRSQKGGFTKYEDVQYILDIILHDDACEIVQKNLLRTYEQVYCNCSQRDFVFGAFHQLGLQQEFWEYLAKYSETHGDFHPQQYFRGVLDRQISKHK